MALFFKTTPPPRPPWREGVSIYEHILQGLSTGDELTDHSLPDDDDLFDQRGLRFASGALDGSYGHHGSAAEKASRKVINLVKKIAAGGHQKEQIELYHQLAGDDLIAFLDPTLDVLASLNVERRPPLQAYARLLATRGRHRGPVKFGIALLGLIGDPADETLVTILGKHDEFTLYAAVYLVNTFQNANTKLWELAQCVHGWGRIHLVERLFRTENANIKRWLLREGFRNTVMDEYLAFICAMAGDLHIELDQEEIDEPLLDGAARLIEAMIEGGPAEGIYEYPYALTVIQAFMRHLNTRDYSLNYAATVLACQGFLVTERGESGERSWFFESDEEALASAHHAVQTWLNHPGLKPLIARGLESEDDTQFVIADRMADLLGVPTLDAHWRRLKGRPYQSERWLRIMVLIEDRPMDLEEVLEYARRVLPLQTLSGMTPEETGTLPGLRENALHYCLMEIVSGLSCFPGQGVDFLLAALENPLADLRRAGVNLIYYWGDLWRTPTIIAALEAAKQKETDRELKRLMSRVLKGGAVDPPF